MYVSLLVMGGLTSVIGLALVATGLTAHEAPLDPEFMTSGVIAIIGGLVLVGLGFAVRALQRIEALLAARQMPRAARPAEVPGAASAAAGANPVAAAVAVAAVEQAIGPPRPVAPPKPKAEPRPQFAAPAAAPPVEEPAFERMREKFPTLVRFDTGVVADESYAAAPEIEPVEEEVAEVRSVSVAARGNGAAAPVRSSATRLDTTARRMSAPPPSPRQKASVFEAFWPNGQRPRRSGPPAATPGAAPENAVPAAPPARAELAQRQEAVAIAHPIAHTAAPEPSRDARRAAEERAADEAGPVSVLKSGVVEGMAYTLYSDGSIEAQLPQGRLRFGSITELRHHIEGDA